MSDENTTKYEIMIIFSPELAEDKFEKELEEVRKLIKSNNGEIYNEDIWGLRDFAYRINKQDQGYYAVINFAMDPKNIDELEKPLNLNQSVFRFLVTKPPHNFEIKSLQEYEKEAEAEEKEEEKKESKKEEKPKKKVIKKEEKEEVKKEPVKEAKFEKEEKPKEIPKEKEKEAPKEVIEEIKETEDKREEEPKKEPKKEEKPSKEKLDEVDEKLKSIINDPDISL